MWSIADQAVGLQNGPCRLFSCWSYAGGTFALYSLLSRTARLDAPSRVFDGKDLSLRQYNSTQSFSNRGRREGQASLPVTTKDVTNDPVADDTDNHQFVPPNKVRTIKTLFSEITSSHPAASSEILVLSLLKHCWLV